VHGVLGAHEIGGEDGVGLDAELDWFVSGC
jgi:hypothetical protein